MSRLTAGEQTAISANAIRPFNLIKFEFDGGTQYFTDYGYDISYDSQTWQANGFILKTPDIQEVFDFQSKSVSIRISNVNQSFLAVAQSEQIFNRKVSIYKGLLTGSDDSSMTVNFAASIFIGYIASYSANASEFTLTISGLFNDFQRTNGRMMSTESQARYYPSDLGFEYAAQNNRQLTWGYN